MKPNGLSDSSPQSGAVDHPTELTLSDGTVINVNWTEKAMTVRINGSIMNISSKSRRVKIGLIPETAK